MNYFCYFVSSLFFIGKVPYAPGSIASFCTLLFVWFIDINFIESILLFIPVIIIGIYTSYKTELYLKKKDPSVIVIDETIGMYISLLLVPKQVILYIIAFVLFRLLDIYKPLYINTIQKYPYGLGVIADDVLAGILTFLFLHIFII